MRKRRLPAALTIAGSDSSGGAGVEADLKTFSALNVYGTCAITAVTAQNTMKVNSIYPLPVKVIIDQIKAVLEDIPIENVKVGMVYTSDAMVSISKILRENQLRFVLDPVMRAGSGAALIKEKAKRALIEKLIPCAFLVTPNRMEAEEIANIKIKNVKDMIEAAKIISNLGAESVLIKGGHIKDATAIDILYFNEEVHQYRRARLNRKFHGTGCTLSSAITAFLARGYGLLEAVEKSEDFMSKNLKFSEGIGKGRVPVNQFVQLYIDSDRWRTLQNVSEAVERIERLHRVVPYIPEVGMQVAMAIKYAEGLSDVAAVEGRIFNVKGSPKPMGRVWFGASKHLANVVLTAKKYDDSIRAAVNLHYSPELLKALRKAGFTISSFNRAFEPIEVKLKEGTTLSWGVEEAIKAFGGVPDVIYDLGEVGKEPMIRVLGQTAIEVINKIDVALKKLG